MKWGGAEENARGGESKQNRFNSWVELTVFFDVLGPRWGGGVGGGGGWAAMTGTWCIWEVVRTGLKHNPRPLNGEVQSMIGPLYDVRRFKARQQQDHGTWELRKLRGVSR